MKRIIYLIFGKTGSGKTTLAKKLMNNFNRFIIIDALAEYTEGIIFYTYEDFRDYLFYNDTEKDFKFILRYTTDEDFEKTFGLIFELENFLLVIEEAEIYISPYTKKSAFLRIVNYGRHKEISIIGIARRTAELSLSLRAQVDKIFSFKQTETKDIINMEKLGLNGLNSLPEYQYKEISY